MKIVFLDGIGGNYSGDSLTKKEKIGGTEITIIRTAEMLANQSNFGHQVFVLQEAREKEEIVNQVHYRPLADLMSIKPNRIIGVRPRRLIAEVAKQFIDVPCYYWMHDIPSSRLWKYKRKFSQSHCNIIAISHYQHQLIETAWSGNRWQRAVDKILQTKRPPVHIVSNPIATQLQPNQETVIDKNKLIFFSAPDRGLKMILENFFYVLKYSPNFKLYIAHPGYANLDSYRDQLSHPNIVILGTISNAAIIQHVRESLCVFYPQSVKPECFGLVYAEANAIGTPVLAHNFGAAAEVLATPEQLIDATDQNLIVERLLQWQQQRPVLTLKSKFREEHVLKAWEELLMQ